MAAQPPSTGKRVGLFVGVAALSGVVAAGLILPAVGIAGITARNAVSDFEGLPAYLQTPPLPQQSQILAADGSRLATFFAENRVVVPLTDVAPVMQQAIISVEDVRFFQHNGVDVQGTVRALVTNLEAGGVSEGGSTLTQQYVENLLVAGAESEEEASQARARRITAKIQEARFAIGLEKRFTKQQILEGYLNVAFFGNSSYGVEAASRSYFSKPAADLTLPEAALLAGLVQSPNNYDPLKNPEAAQNRRNVVLQRMADAGAITAAEAAAAREIPVGDTLRPSDVSNGCTTASAPFFCDYVVNIIRTNEVFGATEADREALLRRGGLTIRTTLDPKAQAAAQQAVAEYLPKDDASKKATAIAMVEPGSGLIVAMAQNRDWGTSGTGKTTYNYAVDRDLGGTVGMQAGSTMKPFVAAAALEKGFSVNERISAPAKKTFYNFRNCSTGKKFPPYPVRNSTGSGTFNLKTGTALSVNTFYVGLEERIGQCRPVEIAETLGVTTGSGEPLEKVPSFVLGSQPVSPLSMAEAYATFAANGIHCDSIAILEITDREGRAIPVPAPNCQEVLQPKVASEVTQLLAGVIDGNISGRTGKPMSLGRPAAGKTGTTNGNAAVWFVGYTPNLAAAVWAGDPRGGTKYPMEKLRIKGRYYDEVFGSTLPGPIWKAAMLGALAGRPPAAWPSLDPRTVEGVPVKVPAIYGLQPIDAIAALAEVGLAGAVVEEPIPSSAPLGTIAGSSPRAGSTALSGSTVTLYLSSGTPPPRPSPTATAQPSPAGTAIPPSGGTASPAPPTPAATVAPAAATAKPKPTKRP
jgi:membrane peptidoglycan carboxypeptidase